MTSCSTWHVRIDMVEEAGSVTARAKLIGAPAAMLRTVTVGCESDPDVLEDLNELLATWRPIDELGSLLSRALSQQHDALAPASGSSRP